MDQQTTGTVVSVAKQWWLKINTKAIRAGTMDGATFPYIIKVQYTVNGKDYQKTKWLWPSQPVPAVGSTATVLYCSSRPAKAKII